MGVRVIAMSIRPRAKIAKKPFSWRPLRPLRPGFPTQRNELVTHDFIHFVVGGESAFTSIVPQVIVPFNLQSKLHARKLALTDALCYYRY